MCIRDRGNVEPPGRVYPAFDGPNDTDTGYHANNAIDAKPESKSKSRRSKTPLKNGYCYGSIDSSGTQCYGSTSAGHSSLREAMDQIDVRTGRRWLPSVQFGLGEIRWEDIVQNWEIAARGCAILEREEGEKLAKRAGKGSIAGDEDDTQRERDRIYEWTD